MDVTVTLDGAFFAVPAPATATFAAASGTATLTVATVDDDVAEYNGSVTAAIGAIDHVNYAIGDPGSATVTVRDNEVPLVTVTPPQQATVEEGDEVTFILTRTGDTSAELTVQVRTQERNTLNEVRSAPTFAPGERSIAVTVATIENDFYDEGDWFTFISSAVGQLSGRHL